MKTSDHIDMLAASLSLAQGELENAPKDTSNTFFKSKYASLAVVIDTAKPILAKNGLSVAQNPVILESQSYLATRLMHKSGQWIEGYTPILAKDNTAQAFGSGMTYARRYALAAILNITQDDDDAHEATHPKQYSQQAPMPQPAQRPPNLAPQSDEFANDKQVKLLNFTIEKNKCDMTQVKSIIRRETGQENINRIPKGAFNNVLKAVQSLSENIPF